MNFIIDFFANNFENCIWLAVLLIAICPTLESKIAIPFAMNRAIWGSNALSPFSAFLIASLGALIPSYLILILSRKLKNKTTGFITSKYLNKYTIKGSSLDNKKSEFKKYLTLTGFVSLPLPLTGVWTGSLIAGLTNLNINYSFLSILIGNIISSAAMTILCTIFSNSIAYIFMISLLLIIIFMFIELFSSMFRKKKSSI